jgi:hypothetical protein
MRDKAFKMISPYVPSVASTTQKLKLKLQICAEVSRFSQILIWTCFHIRLDSNSTIVQD